MNVALQLPQAGLVRSGSAQHGALMCTSAGHGVRDKGSSKPVVSPCSNDAAKFWAAMLLGIDISAQKPRLH